MAKNIRSEFVKKLMDDKSNLESVLAESAGNAIRDILGDSIKSGIRNILKEADDKSFTEEEVVEITPEIETKPEDEKKEDVKEPEAEAEEEIEVIDTDELDKADEEEDDVKGNDGENEAENDIWSTLEDCKNEDGEYDLTGMGKEAIIDIIKGMNPEEDEIRIVKNEDGDFELTDDDKTAVFTEDDLETEEGEEKTKEDETEYELELNDEGDNLFEDNLGYDAHQGQDKTAMTMPDDKDDAKGDIKMDAGLPKGKENDKQNWAGNAKAASEPYKAGREELVFEVEVGDEEIDDTFETEVEANANEGMPGGARVNKIRTKGNDSEAWKVRNPRNHVSRTDESMDRKFKAIIEENKQLRKVATEIKKSLEENVVINKSLAKVIKLIVENTTTRDEKVDIVKRFNNVKTLNECNELYDTISGELKKAHKINESNILPNPVSEPKKVKEQIVENRLDESRDVKSMQDLMERMSRL